MFIRYDKNNDDIIAVSGLNRLLNELATVLGHPGAHVAGKPLLDAIADGNRVHFNKFKAFVDKEGLVGLLRINRE